MTRVKICGLTNAADATAAAEAGAAMLGFVFWSGSPRAVAPTAAAAIVGALPHPVVTVGVFVNADNDEIVRTLKATGVLVAQLHGDEREAQLRALAQEVPVIRAVGLSADRSAERSLLALPREIAWLVDAHDPARRGGTGGTTDWAAAARLAAVRPVILAGGLTPANVGPAIARVRPWAVDVSSGVEAAPGRKDHARIRAFVAAAHGMDVLA